MSHWSNVISRRQPVIVLFFVFCFSFSGCSGFKVVRVPIPIPTFGIGSSLTVQEEEPKRVSREKVTPQYQVGVASWYGRKFHGRRTANGERYDMYDLTAAHQSLPFDTQVKVTNLENGRVVNVRINDRGPYKPGRIIDLSRQAATELDFLDQGLAQVRIEPL